MPIFPKPEASLLVTLAIPSLALIVLTLIAAGIARSSRWRDARGFALGVVAWLSFTALLALSGVFTHVDRTPPPMLLLVVPALLLPTVLGLSQVGEALARQTPLVLLVGFHAFRLPLELIMHQAAREGVMPEQMTFTGANLDIITGASALVLAAAIGAGKAPRWLVFGWNAMGTLLLLAIIAIAVASLPRFHAFGSEPGRLNTWVSFFPFVWLPAGLVTSALFGHVVLWRHLLGLQPGRLELTPSG